MTAIHAYPAYGRSIIPGSYICYQEAVEAAEQAATDTGTDQVVVKRHGDHRYRVLSQPEWDDLTGQWRAVVLHQIEAYSDGIVSFSVATIAEQLDAKNVGMYQRCTLSNRSGDSLVGSWSGTKDGNAIFMDDNPRNATYLSTVEVPLDVTNITVTPHRLGVGYT